MDPAVTGIKISSGCVGNSFPCDGTAVHHVNQMKTNRTEIDVFFTKIPSLFIYVDIMEEHLLRRYPHFPST